MFTQGADEVDYGLSIALGFASLFIELSGFRAHDAMRRCVFGYDTGIRLHGDWLVLKWNNDDSETSYSTVGGKRIRRDAHGWRRRWSLLDVVLDNAVYASKAYSFSEMFIAMPEKTHMCTVKLHRDKWKRPRWPFAKRINRATIEIPNGIPIPGKGENSWDCGEDRVYSSTMPAGGMLEAIAKLHKSIADRRVKYGGHNWKPEGVQ